ncbi:MAG TPA: TIM barrel protein [Acidimicrobiales bacterium]|nr:TIM barrel protein [Acidimicrobiales bacterium]
MTLTDPPGICIAGLLPEPLSPTKEALAAALAASADAGFAEMSSWAWLLPMMAADGTHAGAAAALGRMGLRVRMVEAAFAWATGASDEEARADAATVAGIAEAVGASLVMAVCLEPTIPDRARAQARLAEVADRARAVGARTCVEFLPWSAIPGLRDAWDLVAPLDDVGLIVDMWHWQRQPGGPATDALKDVPPERVYCLQLADAPAQAEGELMEETMTARLLPGDGDVDYGPVKEWLAGAAPFVAPEVFNGGLVVRRGVGPLAAATYEAAVRVMA